ncbi:hypothetical protein EYF80_064248 [Liparis tanakae]|uniref:Uncharacterized protein n=1 Tax=Liparis tanakae TaxID=230148 RepID=A0A4Z2EA42_9TELE|nr:hypothetical protein EYF80_064248 [Liparis tanakae]
MYVSAVLFRLLHSGRRLSLAPPRLGGRRRAGGRSLRRRRRSASQRGVPEASSRSARMQRGRSAQRGGRSRRGRSMAPPERGRSMAPPERGRSMAPPERGRSMAPPEGGHALTPHMDNKGIDIFANYNHALRIKELLPINSSIHEIIYGPRRLVSSREITEPQYLTREGGVSGEVERVVVQVSPATRKHGTQQWRRRVEPRDRTGSVASSVRTGSRTGTRRARGRRCGSARSALTEPFHPERLLAELTGTRGTR